MCNNFANKCLPSTFLFYNKDKFKSLFKLKRNEIKFKYYEYVFTVSDFNYR